MKRLSYLTYCFAAFFLALTIFTVAVFHTSYSDQYDHGHSFSLFSVNSNLAFAFEDTPLENGRHIDNDPINALSVAITEISFPFSFSPSSSSHSVSTLTSISPSYVAATQLQYEQQNQYQQQPQQQQPQQQQQHRDVTSGIAQPSMMVTSAAAPVTPPSLTSPPPTATPPPTLNIPADTYVEAVSSAGARVNYAVSAAAVASGENQHQQQQKQQQLLQKQQLIPISASCSPPSGSIFPIGTTTVTCTATDNGKSVTKSFKIVVRDTTPPLLTFPANNLVAKAESRMTTAVSYSTHVSASDNVDGRVTPVCSPPSGSIFPIGTSTVTCTATDRHGNSATGSFDTAIRYPVFGGFLEPISSEGTTTFQLGNTIPIRLELKWPDGKPISDAKVQIYNAKISDRIIGANPDSTSVSTSSPGGTLTPTSGNYFMYDSSSGRYVFNLGTKHLSPGTWQIKVILDDGGTHTANISLVG
jgi:hypothetical protein